MRVWRSLAKKATANQHKEIMVKSTLNGLQSCRWKYVYIFIRLAVVSQICEIPRNYPKIQTYSSSRSSKSSIFVPIETAYATSYRSRDIDAFCYKIPRFPPPKPVGMPCDIKVIYTQLKSKFNGLQFHRWQYRSIFIRLAVVASQICKIPRNSERIRAYSSSRSSKVIDLGIKRICNFLLVINSNFGCIFYRFQVIDV